MSIFCPGFEEPIVDSQLSQTGGLILWCGGASFGGISRESPCQYVVEPSPCTVHSALRSKACHPHIHDKITQRTQINYPRIFCEVRRCHEVRGWWSRSCWSSTRTCDKLTEEHSIHGGRTSYN